MKPKRSSSTRSTVKSRFTRVFLRALLRMNLNRKRVAGASPREIRRRYLRVKLAADVSMASAVGTRRAWSRAMLRKIRSRGRTGFRLRRSSSPAMKTRNPNVNKCIEEEGVSQTDKLRKLVPGGEEMDICCLLDETAHYMKCLATQVEAMRRISEICST